MEEGLNMKERITKSITKRFALVIMMAAILFAAMPMAGFEANAAAVKPGGINSIKAKDITSETATLKWAKAKGKVTGYAIYRNGKFLTVVNAKTFSYKEKNLKYSTKYTYYVRAYNRTGKKVRQYYNKKTKKWQRQLPAKQYRGKSRVIRSAVFGAKSPNLTVRTMKPFVKFGKKITPSMCPMTFVNESTKCKKCGKGQTIKMYFKNGCYDWTITGVDCSKKCPYHD
jgi:hypothetical protein